MASDRSHPPMTITRLCCYLRNKDSVRSHRRWYVCSEDIHNHLCVLYVVDCRTHIWYNRDWGIPEALRCCLMQNRNWRQPLCRFCNLWGWGSCRDTDGIPLFLRQLRLCDSFQGMFRLKYMVSSNAFHLLQPICRGRDAWWSFRCCSRAEYVW